MSDIVEKYETSDDGKILYEDGKPISKTQARARLNVQHNYIQRLRGIVKLLLTAGPRTQEHNVWEVVAKIYYATPEEHKLIQEIADDGS